MAFAYLDVKSARPMEERRRWVGPTISSTRPPPVHRVLRQDA
jgi:hypothetical protein